MTGSVLRHRGNWSIEQQIFLITHYPTEMPTQQIADRLGKTITSVWGMAQTLGVTTQHFKRRLDWEGRDEELRTHVAGGKSSSQIARIFGVTRNAIIGRCDRLGLNLRGKVGGRQNGAGRPRSSFPRQRNDRLPPRPKPTPLPHRVVVASTPITTEPKVSLVDRERHQCAWILRDGSFDELTMCGEQVVYRSYCRGHARKAYQGSAR